MAKHASVDPDPKEIKRAEELWAGFTNLLTYSTIATVAVVALLGLIFIDW